MTHILGAVTRGHAFHASDRLITRTHPKNATEAWDIASNKTVIVIGADCWLAIGYTGLAYLDDLPTDQFIAEAIAGRHEMIGMGSWHRPIYNLNYRAITHRVENEMAHAYDRLPSSAKGYATTLLGTGLQRNSSGAGFRHVMFESRVSAAGATHQEIGERRQPLHRFGLHGVGSVDTLIHSVCRAEIKEYGCNSPERLRSALTDAVQATGRQSEFVGEDVMSVTLRPDRNRVEVHFTQAPTSRTIEIPARSKRGFEKSPLVYTPYFLGPGLFFSPSIATPGGWEVFGGSVGNITFDVAGPGLVATPGSPVYYGSHERKQPR